jgi:Protein of unknown function (DUF3149)
MSLLNSFLSTDYGLLSAISIGVTVVMGAYLVWFFRKQYKADCELHDRQQPERP